MAHPTRDQHGVGRVALGMRRRALRAMPLCAAALAQCRRIAAAANPPVRSGAGGSMTAQSAGSRQPYGARSTNTWLHDAASASGSLTERHGRQCSVIVRLLLSATVNATVPPIGMVAKGKVSGA